MSLRSNPTRRAFVAAAIAVAVTGCATPPSAPEDIVRQRALEYWQAYQAGDFEKAYTYLSPASRAVVPYDRYRGRIAGSVPWKGADVESVTCETSEKCIVKMKLAYEPPIRGQRLGTIERYMDETWLLDGGQWWRLFSL